MRTVNQLPPKYLPNIGGGASSVLSLQILLAFMTNVAIQDSDYKADILSWWFYFQIFPGKLTVHIKALSIKINLPLVDCGVM